MLRMILYFPVSALVTLFANILQNPQDARTRSDIRLMNQVVSFLSSIGADEETGGVKRMLGVCIEFERLAKIVLDKNDKESHSRRKRKNNKDNEEPAQQPTPGKRTVPPTPDPVTAPTPRNILSSPFQSDLLNQPFSPPVNGYPSPNSLGDVPLMPDYMPGPGDFPNMMTDFSDMQQFGNGALGSPLNIGSFQQPFVPQDLWQMPMNLEWDWTDMQANGNVPPGQMQPAAIPQGHYQQAPPTQPR